MITTNIITAILTLLEWFISIFPNANQDVIDVITEAVTQVNGLLVNVDFIFPVNTFYFLLGLGVSMQLTLYGLKLLLWIVSMITIGRVHKP